MKFTWLTYAVAIRRAHRREYQAYLDHMHALRGPEPWVRAFRFTDALVDRAHREGGRR